MTDEELKALKKAASTKKRIASDLASKIHDLVEDTYWNEYAQLPELAAEAVAACEEWAAAKQVYDDACKQAESA
ncbi:MAG: hypothetical protein CMI09_14220 [Oceanospirillaceae bacterium]|nr:hypothetical protein [Oceanospirillaceae bacterium]